MISHYSSIRPRNLLCPSRPPLTSLSSFPSQHPYFSIGVRPSLPLSSSPVSGDRPSSHSINHMGKDPTNLEVRQGWGAV